MKNTESKTQLTVVETSLQQSFNGISPAELCAAFADTEYKRADWLVSAVMFGLKCIAAKPQVKHGDFMELYFKSHKGQRRKEFGHRAPLYGPCEQDYGAGRHARRHKRNRRASRRILQRDERQEAEVRARPFDGGRHT